MHKFEIIFRIIVVSCFYSPKRLDPRKESFDHPSSYVAYIVEPPHISNLNGSVKNKSEIETHGGVYGYGSVEEED